MSFPSPWWTSQFLTKASFFPIKLPIRVSNARGSPRGMLMPSPRGCDKLRMPHPRDWQREQMPRGCPGGRGTAGIDWCISKAPSTLIRFQTKTKLFCSVFKKIWVCTYRFRIVFPLPHYNAVSVLKTLLYPQCVCSNELDACAFQYIGPRNWREIKGAW